MLRRRLLTILFICVLLPALIVLVQSSAVLMLQKKTTTDMSGRYIRSLAVYAADRWDEGNTDRIGELLSLLDDHGYDAFTSGTSLELKKGKFVPGMVAYISLAGRMIACSNNAQILQDIFSKALHDTGGRIVGADGHIVGTFQSGEDDISYVAYIAPTRDPRIYAVAAVTLMSWMGRDDFDAIKLAAAGITGMLICIAAIFLLRSSVIAPLRALASVVSTLRWGSEMPPEDASSIGDIRAEEITSLKSAVKDLASRMIEKRELENRYVGDIIKAQEEERGRIAQDIHDGPIQVLSALMQKIQIASMTAEMSDDARSQLAAAEGIADDLVQDLRDICDSLVPPWVSLGTSTCIEETALRLERQHGVAITANVEPGIELSQQATLALFRIFQEAVSNAVKHGGAAEICASLQRTDDGFVEFTIADDGSGFDAQARTRDDLVRDGRRGINGVHQRIGYLRGTCEITSSPGSGTSVVIKLPFV